MPSPIRRLLAVAATAVVAALALAGCGGGEQHVALAVTDASWTATGDLAITTECADIDEATFQPTTDGQPGTITIWGDPKVGTCRPNVVIPVPDGTTKVVDAASSEVVDLPAR